MWRFLDTEINGGIRPFNNCNGNALELVDFSRGYRVFSIQDTGQFNVDRRKGFLAGQNYKIEYINPFFSLDSGESCYPTNNCRALQTKRDFRKVLNYARKRFPKISQEVVLPYQVGNPDLHQVAFLEGVNIADVKRVDWDKYKQMITQRFYESIKNLIRKRLKGDIADLLIKEIE